MICKSHEKINKTQQNQIKVICYLVQVIVEKVIVIYHNE